jgi:hypothetical protein
LACVGGFPTTAFRSDLLILCSRLSAAAPQIQHFMSYASSCLLISLPHSGSDDKRICWFLPLRLTTEALIEQGRGGRQAKLPVVSVS